MRIAIDINKRNTRSVVTSHVFLFRIYSMDVFYSGVVRAFHEVFWVVWTDTCMHKTVVVPYVIKMFDGFITL